MKILRCKKNGLRPCKYVSEWHIIENAYFHHFGTSGNQDVGFHSIALIEDHLGRMHEVDAWRISFDDVINIGDKVKLKLQNGTYMDFTVRVIDGDYITGETDDGGFWTNTISSEDILICDNSRESIIAELIDELS